MTTDTRVQPDARDGVIAKTAEGLTLRFVRHLRHPVAQVWAALTEPAQVRSWLGELDGPLETGATYELILGPNRVGGTVLEVIPLQALAYTWEEAISGPTAATVRWQLAAEPTGTQLTFTSTSSTATFLPEGGAGWEGILDSLRGRLDGVEVDGGQEKWRRLTTHYAETFDVSPSLGLLDDDARPGDGSATVRFVRFLDHPPERVWAALTDPAQTARWLAAASIDQRVGGSVEISFEGGEVVTGTVRAIEPGCVLEYTWVSSGTRASVVRWHLEPRGDGTRLELTHTFHDGDSTIDEFLAGWHLHLDGLADALAGGSGGWADGRFAALKAFYAA